MDEQRTDDWFAARLGKVTASRVADVIAKTKTGYSASRENYMAQLVVERLTQTKTDSYTNSAMQWGTDQEPFARAAYEAAQGVMVEEVGFIPHPTIEWAGASPDGLVGDDGLVEIKCPETKGMIEVLLTQKVPQKYFTQMQFQMACTGRKWCDFVSYCAEFGNSEHALFITRVMRDDDFIADAEKAVIQFLTEVELQLNQLRGN